MFGQAKKMVYQNAEVKIYQVKDKAGVKYVGVNSAGMPVTVTVMSKKQAVKGSVKFPDCSECCGYDKKGKCICYKFYQCGQPK